jgi:hypothetical protein
MYSRMTVRNHTMFTYIYIYSYVYIYIYIYIYSYLFGLCPSVTGSLSKVSVFHIYIYTYVYEKSPIGVLCMPEYFESRDFDRSFVTVSKHTFASLC